MTATRSQDLSWIHRCNIGLLLLLSSASLYLERVEVTTGLLMGGLISIFNFRAISRIVTSALQGGNQAVLAVKLMFKLLLLMGVVSAVLIWCPVDAIAFVVGVSVTFISIGLIGTLNTFRTPASNPESSDA